MMRLILAVMFVLVRMYSTGGFMIHYDGCPSLRENLGYAADCTM